VNDGVRFGDFCWADAPMAEIAVDRANDTRFGWKSAWRTSSLQASHVERMFAGVAVEIISAKREQKSSDREAAVLRADCAASAFAGNNSSPNINVLRQAGTMRDVCDVR